MLIEIQCSNTTSSGRTCGEKIVVSNDRIGEFVTCSKCNGKFEVSEASTHRNRARVQEVPVKPTKSKTTKKARFRTEEGDPEKSSAKKKKSKLVKGVDVFEKIAIPKNALRGMRLPSQVDEPKGGGKGAKAGDQDSIGSSSSNEPRRPQRLKFKCTKCGAISKFGHCDACGNIEKGYENLYKPLDEIEIRTTGFQRWFTRSMSDDATMRLLSYVSHFLVGAVLLFIALFGVLAFIEHGIATDWNLTKDHGIAMLVGVFFLTLLYMSWVRKGHEFKKSATARLNWFQRPFWTLGLFYCRLMSWQLYDSKLKGRTIVRVRDSSFGDMQLEDLDTLKTVEVLDLQKTQITDEGLKFLYNHKHLCCLVVRKTGVSHEAVFRLQQAIPRLWIWK